MERPTDALPQPTPRDQAFRRGVSLNTALTGGDEKVRPEYAKFLDQVVEIGATDLELIVRWWQVDNGSIEIAPSGTGTIEDDVLMWIMDEADSRGLRVALTPVLEVESQAPGQWRGSLAPKSWQRWWWSYQRFVMHYARIAAGHHAQLLSVGSELVTTENQADKWRDLVADVRKVYKGKTVYAANIDHLDSVSFWDAVDVVGVTGHQRLLEAASGTDEQIRKQLAPLSSKLRSWALAHDKSYLFTELGARGASATASIDPASTKVAPMEELRRSRTLFELWHDDPRLAGMFAGSWRSATAPVTTATVAPRDQVLRYWYRASRVDAQGSL